MFRIRGKEDSPGVYRAIFNCGHLTEVSELVSNLMTDKKVVTDIETKTKSYLFSAFRVPQQNG